VNIQKDKFIINSCALLKEGTEKGWVEAKDTHIDRFCGQVSTNIES
jgi:hypothetical protein